MPHTTTPVDIVPITGKTKLTGLLGSPVSHSLSPLMHNDSFRHLGLDYVYLCFDVKEDGLPTAVEGLKSIGISGFNLTMPNKNKMFELLDDASPAASIIGAVNTVVNQDGKLIGHNTDGIGFMRALADSGYSISGKKMTMLGAGGAASAILTQAALDGVTDLNVFTRPSSRFHARTVQLVDNLNRQTGCRTRLFDQADTTMLRDSLTESDILVNGTSVGMSPNTDQSLITDPHMLHRNLFVADVIYNPRETLLLKQARENGCQTANGLYMLLYQGAEAFKLWTGREMPVDLIKERYFS